MPYIVPTGAGQMVPPGSFTDTALQSSQSSIILLYGFYTTVFEYQFVIGKQCDILVATTLSVDWVYYPEMATRAAVYAYLDGPGGTRVLVTNYLIGLKANTTNNHRPRSSTFYSVAQDLAPGQYVITIEAQGLTSGNQGPPNSFNSNVAIINRNLSVIEFHNRG